MLQKQVSLVLTVFASALLCSASLHVSAQQAQLSTVQQDTLVQPQSHLQDNKYCQDLYNSRREMTPEEASAVAAQLGSSTGQFCPALLWTYTGTGNTMTRMLIEVASGWYTGSVYTGGHLVVG
jgi:hypothetical protein